MATVGNGGREVRVKDEYLARVLAGEAYLRFDGGMWSLLHAQGIAELVQPVDLLCLSHQDEIADVHRRNVAAGAQVVTTNTFNSNRLKIAGRATVEEVYRAAAEAARMGGARYVAGDIGPTGALLAPMGTMAFDEAYDLFAEQARAAEAAGCDLIAIETMTDLREIKAAVLAAVENTSLPVFATMAFGEDGRTFLGTTPTVAAATLAGLGVSALGVNCSLGPDAFARIVADMAAVCDLPIIAQPNAGMPRVVGGETVFDVEPAEFAQAMSAVLDAGATIVGGCCGTTPGHVAALREVVAQRPEPVSRRGEITEASGGFETARNGERRMDAEPRCGGAAGMQEVPSTQARPLPFVVASAQEAVMLPAGAPATVVIGERINPTGRKRLAEALREGDMDFIVGEAVEQARAGANILDVNTGVPGIDEAAAMAAAVRALEATVATPLQIDSGDPAAIEAAVRPYAGKPLVNSVNGKRESLEAILPVVKRYGCAVVGLTLDEDGVPPTAEGRLAVAERIVAACDRIGIPRSNVAIDCLVMAAATSPGQAREVLRAVALVKERLGVRTVLGVSNVGFGLPQRPLVTATFLAAALGAGLDLPIMNPLSRRCMDAVAAFRALSGQDAGARSFTEAYAQASDPYEARTDGRGAAGGGSGASGAADVDGRAAQGAHGGSAGAGGTPCPIALPESFAEDAEAIYALVDGVLAGRAKTVAAQTEALLARHDGLALVENVFIPALDVVGARYDAGEFFLPQLMAAAEAVKAGFDLVRRAGAQETAGETGAGSGAGRGADSEAELGSGLGAGAGSGSETVAGSQPAAGFASSRGRERTRVVVATVEGDVHDIGKNIARMLLENYGMDVVDLGRDVAPQVIVDAARETGARLVGLSALMTTTLPAMERTVQLLHEQLPEVKVLVAGAVVTPEYAEGIGADFYAKDAAASARIAQGL